MVEFFIIVLYLGNFHFLSRKTVAQIYVGNINTSYLQENKYIYCTVEDCLHYNLEACRLVISQIEMFLVVLLKKLQSSFL